MKDHPHMCRPSLDRWVVVSGPNALANLALICCNYCLFLENIIHFHLLRFGWEGVTVKIFACGFFCSKELKRRRGSHFPGAMQVCCSLSTTIFLEYFLDLTGGIR
jgi:hypothetical protein